MKSTITHGPNTSKIELIVDKAALEFKFNSYWNMVKSKLPQDIVKSAMKGGYRELRLDRVLAVSGGKDNFFTPVLASEITEHMHTQDRDMLALLEVSSIEGIQETTIYGTMLLEPQVTWLGKIPGVDTELKVKKPDIKDDTAKNIADSNIKRLIDNRSIYTQSTDPVKDGNVVDMSISTKYTNGDVCRELTDENASLEVTKPTCPTDDFYTKVLGAKIGDTVTFTTQMPKTVNPEKAGLDIHVTCNINGVMNKELPNVNDDFAKSFGFDSYEKLAKHELDEAEKYVANYKTNLIDLLIMNKIMAEEVVTMDPIPTIWLIDRAERTLADMATNAGDSEINVIKNQLAGYQTRNGTNVVDRQTAITYLCEHAAAQMSQDLVIRSWGKAAKVPGDTGLSNIDDYNNSVIEQLRLKVTFEE
jgi:FKBP-type peptidyl-prolyl cis-trans isomerase (trigger factor)